MPDPPMLSDGKEVRWENWQTGIEFKLAQNADWFPTAHHRIHYVSTRREGRALKHIGPRLHRTSTNRYTDAEDMLEHRKRGLYRKLVWRLQDRVTQYMIDPSLTLQELVRRCQDTATQMNINFKDNPPPARGSGGGRGGIDKDKDKTKSPGSGTALGTPRPQMDAAERAALLKNGQCFYCRGKGHMAKDCPEKKTPAVAAAGNTPAAAAAAPDPRLVEMEAEQPAKD
ncbi:hypothetical protein N7509_000514 [Penicillium cosmopolitanum]|uniref:CCHC-type domain-containing protein n=1 Tax=Penicillium cosmopolitanum TaxID=1131564 RepID=A0A9W9WAQ6_9EURO|nr:uncharacterized protein N7509_000514 [Penicillium cosmopolitanum]KAJ5413887.1 hypothetical protein N7509_000514 [Penicillium cosmopolitanum]